MNNILIVDDDPHIRDVLRFALEKANFTVIEAKDGLQAMSAFHQHCPDLLILDIMMPELDGTEVCRQIRQHSSTPIIFLTAKEDEIDRIVGIEIGADDYVTKPFSPREVVARVKAIFRRIQLSQQSQEQVKNKIQGVLHLELEAMKAFWQTSEVALTATEFSLLDTLMSRPGRVYSRQELMDRAYSMNVIVSDRTIDSHIRRIRQKFKKAGGNPVETVHGVGYKIGPCDQ